MGDRRWTWRPDEPAALGSELSAFLDKAFGCGPLVMARMNDFDRGFWAAAVSAGVHGAAEFQELLARHGRVTIAQEPLKGEEKSDDYGIGSAAAAALHVYEGASRGSGRTTRMVRDLRGYQVVVCPNYDEKQRVERLIREMRPAVAHVVVVGLDRRALARHQLPELMARHPGKTLVLDHTVVLRLYEEAIAQVREDFELEMGRFEHMGPDVVEPVVRREPGRRVL